MSFKIEPGQDYLLDGKTLVRVLRPVNRSMTIFNVESPRCVESVEAHRLKPVSENSLSLRTALIDPVARTTESR